MRNGKLINVCLFVFVWSFFGLFFPANIIILQNLNSFENFQCFSFADFFFHLFSSLLCNLFLSSFDCNHTIIPLGHCKQFTCHIIQNCLLGKWLPPIANRQSEGRCSDLGFFECLNSPLHHMPTREDYSYPAHGIST